MRTVDIDEAAAELSSLIDHVAGGETVVFTRAGKPVAKLVSVDAPAKSKRFDVLTGDCKVPDDFDTIGQDEIIRLFDGEA